MSKLTQTEIKWLARVQKALDAQPKNSNIAFYTVGDNDINTYDVRKIDEIYSQMDKVDSTEFGGAVYDIGASYNESLCFKHNLETTSG